METTNDRTKHDADVAGRLADWRAHETTATEALMIVLQSLYHRDEDFRRAVQDPATRPIAAALFNCALGGYARGVRRGEELARGKEPPAA